MERFMDPIEVQAIISTLDVAYLTMEDLRQWDPARISVFDSSIENEHTLISSVGWEDVPRSLWNSEYQDVPPLLNARHVYSAFGTCTDDMLVLANLPNPLITELKRLESFDRIQQALMEAAEQSHALT
jgi:hypothetical protein